MPDNKIISIVAGLLVLAFIIAILVSYFVAAMGTLDSDANVSAEYEDVYNNTQDATQLTAVTLNWLPFFLGLMALLIVIGGAIIWIKL